MYRYFRNPDRMPILFVMASIASACGIAAPPNSPSIEMSVPEEDYAFLSVTRGPCDAPVRSSTNAATQSDCARMTGPRRYRGTWSVDFEGSFFTPRGRLSCLDSETESCVVLAGKSLPWPSRWACPRAYEIDFIGRRNALPNFFNGSAYKVVVDKLISVRRLPDLPREADQCDANAK
jgi:hypothetical protein